MNVKVDYKSILDFWFLELTPEDWFKGDESLDQKIKSRFFESLTQASKGELHLWRKSPEGRLAEIIVLDQFSRNIFRGKSGAFANDGMALVLAQELVSQNLDKGFTTTQKSFAYMPYMHSESLVIHEKAVELFSIPGLEDNLRFEILHKEIIEKFGRYPHRNSILGRESSLEEVEFLKTHKGF